MATIPSGTLPARPGRLIARRSASPNLRDMIRASRRMRLGSRVLVAASLATFVGLGIPAPAHAHPLGNFTVNTSAALRIRPDEVLVDYVIDLAEIPTVQASSDLDTDGDGELEPAERRRYAGETCDGAAADLALTVDDRSVALESVSNDLSFPEGQAGLSTLRLVCEITGPDLNIDGTTTVRLADRNFPDRVGWREIVAVGDKTTIVDADVPRESTSDRLTNYPRGQLQSPLAQREAAIIVEPGGPAADTDDGGSSIPLPSADRLSSLITERQLTIPFALFALLVSFVLGGFHALAPGHGKTVIAAYLVAQRGSKRHALILGATVAVTHTGGVLAMALVVSNSSVAPERFYPVLGSISGLLVAAIGVVLLRRAVQFRRIFPTLGPGASRHHHHGIGGHTHSHDEEHHDALADHDHDQVPVAAAARAAGSHVEGTHERSRADHDQGHGDHDHGHGDHDHEHDGHDYDHDGHDGHGQHADPEHDQSRSPGPETAVPVGPAMKPRNMMAMGFAGGLVPSPSALVVLLGSIAIGRAWFGLLLIIAYGAGLAAVLLGAGLLIERLRHRIEPLLARRRGSRLAGAAVNLPILTAILVILGGVYLVARAVTSA